jgi:hypothetical protein
MPYAPPPPAQAQQSSGSGAKILGGCGIAGCLGIVVVGGIILVIVLLVGGSSSSSSGSGQSDAPSSGSLRSMVKNQIGPFRLLEVTGRPTSMPSELVAGATDSLAMTYTGNGDILAHIMFAYSTSGVSAARLAIFKCSVTQKEVKNKEGRRIGSLCVNMGSDGKHLAVWTNNNLLFIAHASPNTTAEFYNNVPY